jgi:hypothetical protein
MIDALTATGCEARLLVLPESDHFRSHLNDGTLTIPGCRRSAS